MPSVRALLHQGTLPSVQMNGQLHVTEGALKAYLSRPGPDPTVRALQTWALNVLHFLRVLEDHDMRRTLPERLYRVRRRLTGPLRTCAEDLLRGAADHDVLRVADCAWAAWLQVKAFEKENGPFSVELRATLTPPDPRTGGWSPQHRATRPWRQNLLTSERYMTAV
ncbi:hypothetical protein LAJ19_17000 (plasmid) [Deinococcus taeanensis]|uniref:hypothetical protein n=1 Tax=Deinococcus taeanensis TaxID=2737050 RepID=UPI001CDC81C8|nr:hypothetical protein [Deinococcus taeanensis]UBV44483.1 hypothetical protein LAJ19_17000 [Deinococcus taeanensis]